jgi:hypothetical protein
MSYWCSGRSRALHQLQYTIFAEEVSAMRALLIAMAVVAGAAPVLADSRSPYAGQQTRQVKALSQVELDELRDGRGMGMAKAAELNSYPGPAHVLELRDKLALSAEQAATTQALQETMASQARLLGERILEREAALDQLFRDSKADTGAVDTLAIEIGTLQGQLRAVHLNTHIAMKAVLSADQVAAYDQLRGYGVSNDQPGGHGGHKH